MKRRAHPVNKASCLSVITTGSVDWPYIRQHTNKGMADDDEP